MTAGLLEASRTLLPELVALRRRLHRDPEVGLDLPRTQEAVLASIADLGLEVSTGRRGSSIVAVLRGAKPGPVVLLRADMDALPVREQSRVDYASETGAMHACGHDLHTAALVGAARLLAARRQELAGDVLFMFQPGEEGFDGAAMMLDEGVLEAAGSRPIAAYAAHVIPGPSGRFSHRSGPAMAGVADLHITMHGRGGHGAQPHTAVDPVPAIAELVTALQVMVTRRFSALDPVVLTVAQLRGGDAINVIPDSAALGATVRTLSRESERRVREEVGRLAEGIAAAHGCRAEVRFDAEYPVVVNDDAEATRVGVVLRALFGSERSVHQDLPLMASEDFSRILDLVPGVLFFVGATPAGADTAAAEWNHSPRVVFDDGILGDLAAALASLALERLRQSIDAA